ncbi:MAG: hypothetical protein ACREP9_22360 [Candidatus Dormibacteraceae bacterium]
MSATQYRQGYSSLRSSVGAYQLAYAAPVFPQTNYIDGGFAGHRDVRPATSAPSTMAPVVSRKNRIKGMRFLYSHGKQVHAQFRMRATGAVESSRFQPQSAHTWFAPFNDALYQAGYPGTNLGISEKVPTIPPAALGTAPWQMQPQPRFTRNIYTSRNYGTPNKGIAAKGIIPTKGVGG